MDEYYVIITGGKNNAGDFLIKYRAIKLIKKIKDNIDIIEYNAWEKLNEEQLIVINASKALILCGGPALQYNMYPGIYKLTNNLDDIKVPIILLGIGWKSQNGRWSDTYKYKLSKSSLLLLDRVESDGYQISVRDYHTQNVLFKKGYKNVVMTGCPALYDFNTLTKDINMLNINKKVKKIAFSMGVAFVNSISMEKNAKDLISVLYENSKKVNQELVIAFHHSIDREKYLKVHNSSTKFHKKHIDLIKWLNIKDIKFIDISGDVDKMLNFYNNIDYHIGYRVHAHIYMSSIGKPTMLLSEDGRGKALSIVLSGNVFDAFQSYKSNKYFFLLNRISHYFDRFVTTNEVNQDIIDYFDNDVYLNLHSVFHTQVQIRSHYKIMNNFILSLP